MGALQLQSSFEVCKMWVAAAVVALLVLCFGVMYALRQVAHLEARSLALLQTQAERVVRLQADLQRLREEHAVPASDIVRIEAVRTQTELGLA
jgi:Tfp pilus assembly protein PilN